LAETAVDTETLDLMAIEGVKFTILSPTQARMVRSIDAGRKKKSWQDVSGERIDPTRPYRVVLDRSRNRFIDVFFYDGPLSRAVAYEKMLSSGEKFLGRIEQAFGEHHDGPKLVNVATDGESYGHHIPSAWRPKRSLKSASPQRIWVNLSRRLASGIII